MYLALLALVLTLASSLQFIDIHPMILSHKSYPSVISDSLLGGLEILIRFVTNTCPKGETTLTHYVKGSLWIAV